MSPLWRRLLVVTALGAGVFAGFAIYANVDRLRADLATLSVAAVAAAIGLACLNYVVRFVRWELYLRAVGVRVPLGQSALVFVAGFMMSVTPGKVGELVKAALLKATSNAPVDRVAPVVVAERLTDLVALVVLGIAGAFAYGEQIPLVVATSVVVAVGLLVVMFRPLARAAIALVGKLPPRKIFGKVGPRLTDMYEHLYALIRPARLVWATALGALAWLCECVGFWLIVNGFPGADLSLGLATFIYALTTVAGALSFLPGGLGVAEATMTAMLVRLIGKSTSVAATIVTRLCTLWFAMVIGVFALLALRPYLGKNWDKMRAP